MNMLPKNFGDPSARKMHFFGLTNEMGMSERTVVFSLEGEILQNWGNWFSIAENGTVKQWSPNSGSRRFPAHLHTSLNTDCTYGVQVEEVFDVQRTARQSFATKDWSTLTENIDKESMFHPNITWSLYERENIQKTGTIHSFPI